MTEFNDPVVVAAIGALHDAYERALAANDVPTLNRFFWDSPHTVRYGVKEHLYGGAAIAAYRQAHKPALTDRILLRRSITAFGDSFASVMCEFSQKSRGQSLHSRQSQVWARLPDQGWKIVSAHVSNTIAALPATGSWEAFADQTAAALSLPLDPAHRPGVIANLQRAAAIAAPLLAFPLPADTEIAPVFTP